jgi:hypothetical protein
MTIKIELTTPIEAHGEQVKILELSEPSLGDYRKALKEESEPTARFLLILSNCAKIPPSSLDSISLQDWDKIEEAFEPFLPSSLKAGIAASNVSSALLSDFASSQANAGR